MRIMLVPLTRNQPLHLNGIWFRMYIMKDLGTGNDCFLAKSEESAEIEKLERESMQRDVDVEEREDCR